MLIKPSVKPGSAHSDPIYLLNWDSDLKPSTLIKWIIVSAHVSENKWSQNRFSRTPLEMNSTLTTFFSTRLLPPMFLNQFLRKSCDSRRAALKNLTQGVL
jgi:hypothetical protein